MAIKTTLEQIEELDTAITACLLAQSMGKGDLNVQMARYEALTAERTRFLTVYQQEQGSYHPRTFAYNGGAGE